MKKEDLLYQNIDQPQENPLAPIQKPSAKPSLKFLKKPRNLILASLLSLLLILSLLALFVKNPDADTNQPVSPTPKPSEPTPTTIIFENKTPLQQSFDNLDATINSYEKIPLPQIKNELVF